MIKILFIVNYIALLPIAGALFYYLSHYPKGAVFSGLIGSVLQLFVIAVHLVFVNSSPGGMADLGLYLSIACVIILLVISTRVRCYGILLKISPSGSKVRVLYHNPSGNLKWPKVGGILKGAKKGLNSVKGKKALINNLMQMSTPGKDKGRKGRSSFGFGKASPKGS